MRNRRTEIALSLAALGCFTLALGSVAAQVFVDDRFAHMLQTLTPCFALLGFALLFLASPNKTTRRTEIALSLTAMVCVMLVLGLVAAQLFADGRLAHTLQTLP